MSEPEYYSAAISGGGMVNFWWCRGDKRTVLLAFVIPAAALSAGEVLQLLLEVVGRSRGGLATDLLVAIAVCAAFGLGRQLAIRDFGGISNQAGLKSGSIIALIFTISIAPVFLGGPLLVLGAAGFVVGLFQRNAVLAVWAVLAGAIGVYDTAGFYPPLSEIWLHSALSLIVGLLTVALGLGVSRWRLTG